MRKLIGERRLAWACIVAFVAAFLTVYLIRSLVAVAATGCESNSVSFEYSGAEQCYIVPTGVSQIRVTAVGGAGTGGAAWSGPPGTSPSGGTGGFGANVTGDLSVSPGEELYVEVGGSEIPSSYAETGSFNGGGVGLNSQGAMEGPQYGGNGGGATDIRTVSCGSECLTGGDAASLGSRLLVAGGGGGGGGGGSEESSYSPGSLLGTDGGNGGDSAAAGSDGQTAASETGGTGGGGGGGATQSDWGTAGAGCPSNPPFDAAAGELGLGGTGAPSGPFGGGGGGGYYGGGGGGCSTSTTTATSTTTGEEPGDGGGGAGSSYGPAGATYLTASTVTSSLTVAAIYPPIASIIAPTGGAYTVGQIVPTAFSCSDGTNGPGISSCVDSEGYSGTVGYLATSSIGVFSYSVTATSADGQYSSTSIAFSVVAAPSIPSPISPTAPPTAPPLASYRAIKVDGTSAKAGLACSSGAGVCDFTLALDVEAKLVGDKVVGVSADYKRLWSVGARTFTVDPGTRRTVSVKLDSTGLGFLKTYHSISVRLTIFNGGTPLGAKNLKFRRK